MKNLITSRNSLFDPFFDDFFGFTRPFYNSEMSNIMKTDVEETDEKYLISMELAGFKKEDVSVELKNGYLTVSATHSEEDKEADKKKKYVRRERSFTSCRRTFYVGDKITDSDIDASFENGVLSIGVTKVPDKIPENKKILIK